jgi:hypothetical protein
MTEDAAAPRRPFIDGFDLLFAFPVVAVVLAIGVEKLIQARLHGNEASAIGALTAIGTEEAIFREGDKENDGNLDYGIFSELASTDLLGAELGSGTKQGYRFEATYGFSTSEFLWFAVANPERPGFSGDRSFDTNQAGVIFYTTAHGISLDTNTCLLPNREIEVLWCAK